MNQDKDIDNKPASETRRKLVRGGLSAGPILVTLTSRPVLATTCYSPSETMSGAVSHKAGDIPQCTGESPGVWRQSAEGTAQAPITWPIPHTTLFTQYFTGVPAFYKSSANRYMTMLEVMQLNGSGDPDKMGFHFIGALLNILDNRVDHRAMDVPGLQRMWSEFANTGTYVPFGGATAWGPTDIKNYLISTGIVK
ncbi:MAG: hypothetical protein KDF24_11290 [Rhodocyclaceae bacterium]|nr:hypothetical protein [Rhodocyclaceae bacterium]